MKPTPFPHADADVRQAYAEHLLFEAINYAIVEAKMTPEAAGKVCVTAIQSHADKAKAFVQQPLGPLTAARVVKEAQNG